LNPGLPWHEVGVLTVRLWRSMHNFLNQSLFTCWFTVSPTARKATMKLELIANRAVKVVLLWANEAFYFRGNFLFLRLGINFSHSCDRYSLSFSLYTLFFHLPLFPPTTLLICATPLPPSATRGGCTTSFQMYPEQFGSTPNRRRFVASRMCRVVTRAAAPCRCVGTYRHRSIDLCVRDVCLVRRVGNLWTLEE
jgi:hypothetical protein